ncbi:hypothetical protein ALQ33_03935 [Pseudomonas syringae pv. philadelphi]|uniref:Uncharacterized protein n=1 Tax=Pseudomonas syringae pv. philadelphi TaxID=251706 RepID=A0A3M3YRC8_9PSED|nr:hypothetical protein ALQ33_03935 [Pseudomonas syringae pv. philadelphi]
MGLREPVDFKGQEAKASWPFCEILKDTYHKMEFIEITNRNIQV